MTSALSGVCGLGKRGKKGFKGTSWSMRMKTRIVEARTSAGLREVLPEVIHLLRNGGIIIFPTDTVYGIGGTALDEVVLKKIILLKKREKQKAFLINIASAGQLKGLVKKRPPAARALEKKFWPGALSLVYEASETLPVLLTGKEKKIGARIPSHPVALSLLKKLNAPLISTSANFSGKRAPQTAAALYRLFKGKVDIILDAGLCPLNMPSTVVDVTVETPVILRDGAIPAKAIYKALRIPLKS